MRSRIGLLALLLSAALLHPTQLLAADDLPYTLEPVHSHAWRDYVRPWVGDMDGDGFDEIAGGAIERGEICIMAFASSTMLELAQVNLSIERNEWHMVEFLGWEDIDLDGNDEFLVSYVKDDTLHLHGYGFNGNTSFHSVIASGRDNRKEPWWDGKVAAVARVELGNGATAWAVVQSADMDRYPRQVMLFDAGFDTLLWSVSGGAQWRRATCADVDGDGSDEVIATSSAPQNGASANGTSDDRSHVMVVDDTGEVLWLRALGGGYTDTHAAVGDLDGDGGLEIVTTTEPIVVDGLPTTRVGVWEAATGESLGGVVVEDAASGVVVGPGSGSRAFLSGDSGALYAFELTGSGLELVEETFVAPKPLIAGSWPLGDEEKPRLVVGADGGEVHVLDADLRHLAAYRPPTGSEVLTPHVCGPYRARGGAAGLLVATDGMQLLQLARAPLDVGRLVGRVGAALLALCAVVLAAVPAARREAARLGRQLVAIASPVPPQEKARLELAVLAELELASHNKLELTGPLRSLRRLLESSAEDRDIATDVAPVVGKRVETWRGTVRPALEALVLELRKIGGHDEETRRIADAVSALDADVRVVDEAGRTPGGFEANIERLENALGDVRRTLAARHESSPCEEIGEVLDATESERENAGVETVVDVRALEGARAWISPRGLQLVVTNLVTNAVAAMRDASERRLTLRGRLEDDWVVLDVRDTGRGMTSEEADSAFTYGQTTRPGGGAGLFRSRELLDMYGGLIEIVETAPGEGTLFRVAVRRRGTRG